MQEQYTLEEWIGMLEEAGLDEAEVMKITPELQAAIKKHRETPTHNPKQHAKVIPAVKTPKPSEAYTLEEWMGALEEAGYDTTDMDEGKLSRLAAGLGLAGAAMMGGAKDAGAQQATPTKAPNDSVQTATSRDMGLALNKAGFELNRRRISQQGARQDVRQNPDGTFTATIDARKRPATQAGGTPQMEERYSLEEWLGMLEEAGYDVSEYSLWRPKESGAKSTGVMKDPKKPKTPPAEPTKPKKKLDELSPETLASYRAKATAQKSNIKDKYHGTTSPTTGQTYSRDMLGLPPEATAAGDQRKFQKRTAGIAQANKNMGQQALKNPNVLPKIDYRDDELGAGAAQWQIDRARQSALRQPKGQPKMAAESFTLEEWMGMLEEAGVVEEGWRNALAGLALAGGLMGADRLHNPPQPHAASVAPVAVDARDVAGNLSAIDSMKRAAAERQAARQAADSALRAKSDSIGAKAAATMDRTAPVGVNERDMTNEERYTLEEWMGMMQEAGYNLEEGFMDTLGKMRDTAKGVRHAARFVGAANKGGDAKSALKLVGQSAKHAYDQGGVTNVGNMLRKIGRKDHVQDLLGKMRSVRTGGPGKGSAGSLKIKNAEKDARTGELKKGAEAGVDSTTGANAFYNPLKEKMATKPTPTPTPKPDDLKTPRPSKKPEVLHKENISENIVARLQSLAGIKPTE